MVCQMAVPCTAGRAVREENRTYVSRPIRLALLPGLLAGILLGAPLASANVSVVLVVNDVLVCPPDCLAIETRDPNGRLLGSSTPLSETPILVAITVGNGGDIFVLNGLALIRIPPRQPPQTIHRYDEFGPVPNDIAATPDGNVSVLLNGFGGAAIETRDPNGRLLGTPIRVSTSAASQITVAPGGDVFVLLNVDATAAPALIRIPPGQSPQTIHIYDPLGLQPNGLQPSTLAATPDGYVSVLFNVDPACSADCSAIETRDAAGKFVSLIPLDTPDGPNPSAITVTANGDIFLLHSDSPSLAALSRISPGQSPQTIHTYDSIDQVPVDMGGAPGTQTDTDTGCGDMNDDGSFDIADSVVLRRALAGLGPGITQDCMGQLPATGQSTVYVTDDDGDIQAGATLSYMDNGDGTITDLNTGLMWEKKSNDGTIHDKDTAYNWDDAFAVHVAGLNDPNAPFAGHTDWRMPNVKELQSIIDYEADSPSVDPVFNSGCVAACTVTTCSCTQSVYWSATSSAGIPMLAWVMDFSNGDVFGDHKSLSVFSVRAVRGGP